MPARAALGLIVLATDQTIEHEFRRLLDLPGVALYQSRILNDNAITPATLDPGWIPCRRGPPPRAGHVVAP